MTVNRSGRFFFNQDGARTVAPGCSQFQRWSINAATAEGQAMTTLVITTQAQGKKIVVYGTGDCRDWSDTEAVDVIQVAD